MFKHTLIPYKFSNNIIKKKRHFLPPGKELGVGLSIVRSQSAGEFAKADFGAFGKMESTGVF